MTVFVDTAIFMYAAGGPHPLREPCQHVLDAVSSRRIDAATSVEVVQELFHRYLQIGRPDLAVAVAERTMTMLSPLLAITHFTMRRVPELATRYPSLQARDLVHVATCIQEGITEIISTDRGFDQVAELRRVDPLAFEA